MPPIKRGFRQCGRRGEERQNLFFKQRPDIEFLGVLKVRKSEEEAVSNEVARQIAFQDRWLLMRAVVRPADAVGGVDLGCNVTQRQSNLAGLRRGIFVNIEKVLRSA